MYFSTPTLLTTFALLTTTLAQVPASLSSGFKTELQVSYTGDSSDSFRDGESIPFPSTQTKPVFALGDSSGVNTAVSYLIAMIDSTDESNFILHFLKTDYKATGEKTGLASQADPKVKYTPPGGAGEQGERKYTFLLYRQKSSNLQGVPAAGEKFDSAAFVAANGMVSAVAGLSMSVQIGGPAGDAAPPASSVAPPPPAQTSQAADPLATLPSSTYDTPSGGSGGAGNGYSGGYGGGNYGSQDGGQVNGSDGGVAPMPNGVLLGGGIVTEMPFPDRESFFHLYCDDWLTDFSFFAASEQKLIPTKRYILLRS